MPPDWTPTSDLPPLSADQLQVWRVRLSDAECLVDASTALLTPEERERAARRRAGQVRHQFVIGRAALRILLGNVLSLPPARVPLTARVFGKLETVPLHESPLCFNVAHSKDLILIALGLHGSLGIDVEHIDPSTRIMEVAQSAFHPSEIAQLASLSDPAQRRTLFFRCWTRKEAIIKADGRGLSLPLTSFEVTLGPLDQAPQAASRLPGICVMVPTSDGTTTSYHLTDLPIDEQYAAAIAIAPAPRPVALFDLPLHRLLRTLP